MLPEVVLDSCCTPKTPKLHMMYDITLGIMIYLLDIVSFRPYHEDASGGCKWLKTIDLT